uniref:HPS5-like beta-propeller domain-containing protein n=1 Tax=Clytia hemisphaerica TaxID=252671 RepID=A0A7M5XN45_9CNID
MDSSFILTVFKNHSDVKKSIKKTSIKYNCFATSKSYICFGASTGSTYVYGRSNGELLRFFGNKVHGIVGLCFSPDEKYITAADRTGNVTCWEITSQNYDFKIIKEFIEFDGTTITSMCWDEYSSKLFVGNSKGLIMGFAVGFAAFHKLEVIRKAGDPIVQMDVCNGKLVVSSTTKAILCLLERSQFCQIGTKPRDGLYGTCFLKARPENQPVIYSARPGSRLWEVDFNGQVLATHQFKESLSTPPTPLVTSRELKFHPSNTVWNSPQGFNFPKLCPLMNRYLVTWSSLGIYMIDPSIGSIVAWNDQIKDILDVCCTQNSIYVLHHNGALTAIVLMDVKECLLELRKLEEWMKIAEVSLQQEEGILKSVEQFLSIGFDDVLQRLKEDEQANTEKSDVITEFEEFIQRVEKCHIEVRTLVQERLNQLKLNASDENVRPPDDQDESGDEVRSTVTSLSGISETSSKISLTRLADMKDNLVQKAANAMVSKVMKTGFMKKAFRDALESEGVIIDNKEQLPTTRPSTLHMEVLRTKSTPNSPRVFKKPASIQRNNSDQLLKTEASTPADPRQRFLARKTVSTPALNLDESEQTKSTETDSNFTGAESSDSTTMGSTPTSFQQSTMASDSDSLVIRKKARKPKKKRKAKMVELTMAEEPQDDPLPTEYSKQKTDNLMDQDLPPFFVENILKLSC